jgi:hypothetical protein
MKNELCKDFRELCVRSEGLLASKLHRAPKGDSDFCCTEQANCLQVHSQKLEIYVGNLRKGRNLPPHHGHDNGNPHGI